MSFARKQARKQEVSEGIMGRLTCPSCKRGIAFTRFAVGKAYNEMRIHGEIVDLTQLPTFPVKLVCKCGTKVSVMPDKSLQVEDAQGAVFTIEAGTI